MDVVTAESVSERPRRLLHIPSMTSVPWEAAIRQSTEPVYNVLSYTWGRFTTDGPALDLDGISWKVPGIQPAHFTTEEFKHVLESIAAPSGYVWVDVACIDQDNLAVKMDEIGKQADIFRGAHKAFIWLTRHSAASLGDTIETLNAFLDQLLAVDVEGSNFLYDGEQVRRVLENGLHEALDAVQRLLVDPWFTSLWALQEAYLREDAVLLPRSGEEVFVPSQTVPLALRNISGVFQDIMIRTVGYASISETARDLLTLFERSGLVNINLGMNVPLLIYPAAHFRVCENELDRVYAIMQVYRLRLGASRHPERFFTLDQLEDQLAMSLNAISPMAAQLFIHRCAPSEGKA